MARNVSLQSLAERLEADLVVAYDPGTVTPGTGGQNLVEAFTTFGAAAGKAGISLEDTLSASTGALQDLFERFGGTGGSDPSTFRAAGIALAAAARAHGARATPDVPGRPTGEPHPPTQMARLSALHQINRAATANLQLLEMLDTTARVVAETTNSDACAVFLYDEATGLLALRAAVGLSPASVGAVTLRMGSGITGRAALEGKLIAATDAHSHESFLAHPGIGDEIYTSQVSVPILLQGQNRLVGVLNINSIKRREFDRDELEFLQTVAGELAISIENARQYSSTDERLRQKVAELGTLQRVTRMLASTLDLESVLRLITEHAVELVHADAAAIFRSAPKRAAYDDGVEPIIEYRIGTVRDLTNVQDRNRVVAEVLRTGSARTEHLTYTDGIATLFCLPLRSARETVGALCFRLRANTELSEDTLGLLQAFSDSAAMAIDNAQLYQDAMHSLQTQSALVQEMHHRVRNNLQTVAALLSLQLRTAQDAPWATEVREAISRIQSIAAVHDLLSDERRLAGTTVDAIARLVAEDAHSTLIPPGVDVRFDIRPTDLMVPSRQATIMSLLINELTANAISHGFRERKHGYIRIRAWEESGMANVEVFNDGHKVPEGLNPAASEGLGMKITQRLVTSDLKGTFTIGSDGDGTTALIRFPIAKDEAG
ncbi:MAG TPA: GAF domain-containing protein [Thermomicrobiales bacterium]|nr:GAF domain-containing protein [Thermomicrobiales bacterium]